MLDILERIDVYASGALADWRVPGLAISVVKDGEVIFCKGYGARTLGTELPVDEHTMFALSSNTKGFTAAALAILVDEGKVRWDDPVREYIPYFRLYDAFISEEMRVRDLLCHRNGLGTFSGDILWYFTNLTPRQVIERARYLRPKTNSTRMSFGYANLNFVIAGEVARVASGMESWDDLVETRILRPLGLEHTVTSAGRLEARHEVATGYKWTSDGVVPAPWLTTKIGGSGCGILSSVGDMSEWVMLQLARGKTRRGQALFSERAHREMWQPHMLMHLGEAYLKMHPSTHFRAYGLGWVLRDYKGRKIVSHYGEFYGMSMSVLMAPEENLGFIVMSNSMAPIPIALSNRILDEFLGGETLDWSEVMLGVELARRRKFEERVVEARERVAESTSPALDLAGYAGRYHDRLYGDATIEAADGSLVLRFAANPDMTADLRHLHYDTFLVDFRKESPCYDGGNLQFSLDERANVTGFALNIPCDEMLFHELSFRRSEAAGA